MRLRGQALEQSFEYQFGLHCAHRQRGLKAWQFGIVFLVAAFAPQSPEEHIPVFVDASQIRPFVGVHSSAKQEQLLAPVLGNAPSVMGHCLTELQYEVE